VQQENIHRFFKQMGELTRDLAFKNNVRHLILAGPKERTSEFRKELPQEVRERVVAEDNAPSEAPEGELYDRLEEVYERSEREREAALISQARERGVRGVRDTVEALQEGRVYHVIALYGLEGDTRWCDHDRLAITDITQEECPYCGRDTRIRALSDVVLDLAAARGARVELVRADDPVVGTPNEDAEAQRERHGPAEVLRDEFEGLAGLLRY
jgi:peptide subunit release factor 1 (eRF1)